MRTLDGEQETLTPPPPSPTPPCSLLGTGCVKGERTSEQGTPLMSQPRTPVMDISSRKHHTENPPLGRRALVLLSGSSVPPYHTPPPPPPSPTV